LWWWEGVQVASGTSSLSETVEKRCMAWRFASIRWVGCRWWKGCQGSGEPFIPVIRQIECGQASKEIVSCRVVFGRRVWRERSAEDMMLVEGIRCPESSMCWCIVVYQLLHQGEVEWWWWSGRGRCRCRGRKGRG